MWILFPSALTSGCLSGCERPLANTQFILQPTQKTIPYKLNSPPPKLFKAAQVPKQQISQSVDSLHSAHVGSLTGMLGLPPNSDDLWDVWKAQSHDVLGNKRIWRDGSCAIIKSAVGFCGKTKQSVFSFRRGWNSRFLNKRFFYATDSSRVPGCFVYSFIIHGSPRPLLNRCEVNLTHGAQHAFCFTI